MNRLNKTLKAYSYTVAALLILMFSVAIIFIIAVQKAAPMYATYEPQVFYLTPQEMKARPLLNQKEEITEEPKEEPEMQNDFVDYPIYEEIALEARYQIKAQELCHYYRVGFGFFLAICESESTFNPDASGDSGRSVGLMQINVPNWNRYGLDASIPYDNLEIGIRMLSELIEKYGDFDAVVMAYKGGESFANEWIAAGKRLTVCEEIANRTMFYDSLIQ